MVCVAVYFLKRLVALLIFVRRFWYKSTDANGELKFEVGAFKEKKADGMVVLTPIDGADVCVNTPCDHQKLTHCSDR